MLEEKTGGDREEAERDFSLAGLPTVTAKPTVVRRRLSQGLPTVKPQRPQGWQGSQTGANPVGPSFFFFFPYSVCGVLNCTCLSTTEIIQSIWNPGEGTQ